MCVVEEKQLGIIEIQRFFLRQKEMVFCFQYNVICNWGGGAGFEGIILFYEGVLGVEEQLYRGAFRTIESVFSKC